MVIDKEDLNESVNELEDRTDHELEAIEELVTTKLQQAEDKIDRLMTIEQQRRNNFAKFILDTQQNLLDTMQKIIDFSRSELESDPYKIRDDETLW